MYPVALRDSSSIFYFGCKNVVCNTVKEKFSYKVRKFMHSHTKLDAMQFRKQHKNLVYKCFHGIKNNKDIERGLVRGYVHRDQDRDLLRKSFFIHNMHSNSFKPLYIKSLYCTTVP